jgi:ABC-2 type transport system permease protein
VSGSDEGVAGRADERMRHARAREASGPSGDNVEALTPSDDDALVTSDEPALVRVGSPRGFAASIGEIWAFRELLGNLVRKELKVKYKDSFLGFLWSLARPLFLLMIYWLIFGKFLQAGIPDFAFYLFSGLVAWDFFSSTLGAATTSIIANAGLMKKVYFPSEILPLAAVGAGLVHFALQMVVLFGVLVAFGYDFWGPNLLLLPVAFAALVLFATGMGLLLAAANVYLRDVQHLLEVFLLLWFWLTPVVYPINLALDALARHKFLGFRLSSIYLLNPLTNVVIGFQRAIYKHVVVADSGGRSVAALFQASYGSYLRRLGTVILLSSALVWFAQRVFARAQGNFAQEL